MKLELGLVAALLFAGASAQAQVPPPTEPTPGRPAPAPPPPGAPTPGTPPYTPPVDPSPTKPKPPKDKRKRVPSEPKSILPSESGTRDGERFPSDL